MAGDSQARHILLTILPFLYYSFGAGTDVANVAVRPNVGFAADFAHDTYHLEQILKEYDDVTESSERLDKILKLLETLFSDSLHAQPRAPKVNTASFRPHAKTGSNRRRRANSAAETSLSMDTKIVNILQYRPEQNDAERVRWQARLALETPAPISGRALNAPGHQITTTFQTP